MKPRSKHSEHNSIVQELAVEAIRCGADMIEVEYDEGYEEVYIRKDNIGLGTRFKSSEGDLLRKELYGFAKKEATNNGRQHGVRVARTHLRKLRRGCFSSPMEARLKWATLRADRAPVWET